MKWNRNKKIFLHCVLISILIIYLLSADFLFTQVFTVQGESPAVEMVLPAPSKDIRYNIDNIYDNQIEWKKMITVNGWGFIENQNTENCSIFLVFSDDNSTYVFKTNPVLRRDVTRHFLAKSQNKYNFDNSGFEANIPEDLIKNKKFFIGLLIKNQTAQKYIITKNYCKDGNCLIVEARIDT